jgi:hypothetical protein
MSEQAPRSNSRLDDFEANKAVHEQKAFEDALYADAGREVDGKGNFEEQDFARIQEADTYERHLESLSQQSDTDVLLQELNDQPSPGFDRERDEAFVENERRDGENAAREKEISDKIANDAELRFMQLLANDIAQIRSSPNAASDDRYADRLKDKQDALTERLVRYSEHDSADDAVIDHIIDSTVLSVNKTVPNIEAVSTEAATDGVESVPTSKIDEDADREDLITRFHSVVNQKLAEDTARRDRDESADTSNGAPSDHDVRESESVTPIDVPVRPDVDDSWIDDTPTNEATTSEGGETSAANDEPLGIDVPERESVDDSWIDEDEKESAPKEKFSWLRKPYQRAGALFSISINRIGENLRSKESKRGTRKMTVIALGAIATVGAITAYKLGALDSLFGGNHTTNSVDTSALPQGGGSGAPSEALPGVSAQANSPDVMTFSPAAHDIHGGEGWYETFNDMGIPKAEWQTLLQKTGPELSTHGWAYEMSNGSWGITHPGNLPQDMLELIQKNR